MEGGIVEHYDDFNKPQSDNSYQGPERRKVQRRQIPERREGVRFEVDNPPRRSGIDRRSHQYLWNG
jgi:hypothetical protein